MRSEIISKFNDTADKKYSIHTCVLITVVNIHGRRPITDEGTQSAYSFNYRIKFGSDKSTVCKKAFCSFHDICKAGIVRSVACLKSKTPFPQHKREKYNNKSYTISKYVTTVNEYKKPPKPKSHYNRGINRMPVTCSPT